MAYSSSTLNRVDGVPGRQLFIYRTADLVSTVIASGYFDDAVEEYHLSTGDMILFVAGFGGTQAMTGGVVTLTGTTVTMTQNRLS